MKESAPLCHWHISELFSSLQSWFKLFNAALCVGQLVSVTAEIHNILTITAFFEDELQDNAVDCPGAAMPLQLSSTFFMLLPDM